MEKLLKVLNLPEEASAADRASQDALKQELQALLDNYDTSFQPAIRSAQLLLMYNDDASRFFSNLAPVHIIENKARLWIYDNLRDKREDKEEIKLNAFAMRIQPPVHKYYERGDSSLKMLDLILLYNEDHSALHYAPSDVKKQMEPAPEKKPADETLNFIPIMPRYRLEKVILNQDLREEIMSALLILEKRKIIYEDWGFNEIEPAPKAILNFFGPSGTGKTMTAHAIAAHLGSKILAMNYADIESKYVGDAPKNLVKAFDIAEKENAVLFFDEADSFLGKRITNVSSSSDQAVNSLRSQMLILLENFTGLVIFATNLIANYDKAFESRIFKHLHFGLPDEASRKQIISVTIPPRIVYENDRSFTEEEVDQLVELSKKFSGRHLKNAILNSMITAISDNGRVFVRFDDFIKGFKSTEKSLDEFQSASEETKPGRKISPELQNSIEEAIQTQLEPESASSAGVAVSVD